MKNKFFKNKDEIIKSRHYYFLFDSIKDISGNIKSFRSEGCTDDMRDVINSTEEEVDFVNLGLLLPMDGINRNYYEIFLDIFFSDYNFYNRISKDSFERHKWSNISPEIRKESISNINLGFRYSPIKRLIIKRDLNCAIAVFKISSRTDSKKAWLLAAIHRRILLNPKRFNEFISKISLNNNHNGYYGSILISVILGSSCYIRHSDVLFTSLMYYVYSSGRQDLSLPYDVIPNNPSIIIFSKILSEVYNPEGSFSPSFIRNCFDISENFPELIEKTISNSKKDKINSTLNSLFNSICNEFNNYNKKIKPMINELVKNKIKEI